MVDRMSLFVHTVERICEECHKTYTGWQHDEEMCVECRRMRALERIADCLEYWVGNQ